MLRPWRADDAAAVADDVRRRGRRPLDAADAAPLHARRRRGVGRRRGSASGARSGGPTSPPRTPRPARSSAPAACASSRSTSAARSATSCTATIGGRGVADRVRRRCSPTGRFDELGLGRIEIRADVRNVASRRTIVAAGYRFEGVLRGAMTVAGRARGRRAATRSLPGDPRPWRTPGRRRRPPASAGRGSPTAGWSSGPSSRTTPRPSGRPATTRTSPTGSSGCPRPTRSRTPRRSSPTRATGCCSASAPGSAVTDAASGELLGSVSLDLFADRQAAEIGYWVKREARRRGVALGAARLVVDWAFGELGVERLELLTYPGNEASQALAGQARLHARVPAARLPRARGRQEPGRAGRAVRGRQPPAPRRPGAVRAPALGPGARATDSATPQAQREPPDLAAPAALSGLSPERFSLDPANRLDEKSLRAFT